MSVSTVSDVLHQGGRKDSLGPILVRFDHAEVNPTAFEAEFEVKSLKSEFPKSDSGRTGQNPQISLDISAGKMTYSTSAKSVKGRHGGSPYQRTLIAIRNKKSGRVKLVETSNVLLGAVVDAPPTTNAVLIKEELKKQEEKEAAGEKSEDAKREQRVTMNKHLVGLFGQTKGKRAYEQADRMAVESSKLAQKLNEAAMNVSEQDVALPTDLASAANTDHLIPKCNREAALVEDVYKLEDLIGPEEMSALVETTQEVMENYGDSKETVEQAVKAKTFSRMFANHLERFRKNPKMLGAAIYIEGILQFLNLRPAQFSKGARGMNQSFIPHIVKQKLFQEFTSVQGTISPDFRDKAMCYLIVLSLLVNKFQVDFSELSSSFFRTKADQLKRLVRLVGATMTTDSLTKTSFVVLRLPLASFDVQGFTKKRGGAKR